MYEEESMKIKKMKKKERKFEKVRKETLRFISLSLYSAGEGGGQSASLTLSKSNHCVSNTAALSQVKRGLVGDSSLSINLHYRVL